MRDPYSTLQVPRTATAAQIKRAYRAKAKQHHPDHGGEGFEEIGRAYALLADPAARARFDETGKTEPTARPAEILTRLFEETINHVGPQKNVVRIVRDALLAADASLADKIRQPERQIARLRLYDGRVRVEGEMPNYFALLLERKLEESRRHVAHLAAERQAGQAALQLLGSFHDDFVEL